ncbi:MAG: hypothetical protein AAF629_35705, partial [Chloroflexota bacterium]
LVFVSVVGQIRIVFQAKPWQDKRLYRLGWLFAFKLMLVTLVLAWGWFPQLDPRAESFGVDQHIYNLGATNWVESGFSFEAIQEVSRAQGGIIIYYGLMYAIFGTNPVVAAFINSLTTLFCMLLLIDISKRMQLIPQHRAWWIGFGMLIPEIVWFDFITGKEAIVEFAFVLGLYSYFNLYGPWRRGPRLGWFITLGFAAFTLIAIRPPVLLGLGASLGLISFWAGRGRLVLTKAQVFLVALIVSFVLVTPIVVERSGGYQGFRYTRFFERMLKSPEEIHYNAPAANSISARFQPRSYTQLVWMVIPRFGLYVLSPYPNLNLEIEGMIEGEWISWRRMASDLSIVPYLLFFPFLVLASWVAWRQTDFRKYAVWFIIPWWILMLMPAVASYGLHTRFRVPAMIFFIPCVLLGQTVRQKPLLFGLWYGALGLIGVAYIILKF